MLINEGKQPRTNAYVPIHGTNTAQLETNETEPPFILYSTAQASLMFASRPDGFSPGCFGCFLGCFECFLGLFVGSPGSFGTETTIRLIRVGLISCGVLKIYIVIV